MAGIDRNKIKLLTRLADAGIRTEKDVLAFGLKELIRMQNVSKTEMQMIAELQEAVKDNKVFSYLINPVEVKHDEI